MADEPPPIDDVSPTHDSTTEDKPVGGSDANVEISLDDDKANDDTPADVPKGGNDDDDLFGSDAAKDDDLFGKEPPNPMDKIVDEDTRPHKESDPPTLEPTTQPDPPSEPEPKPEKSDPITTQNDDDDLFGNDDDEPEPKSKTEDKPLEPAEENEPDEEDDIVDPEELVITVSSPEKVGDGMGAYMTYLVTTKTSLPSFKEREFYVRRRFSDFLGLYYQLMEKYSQLGRIVPPAPEKSVSGMTKVKFSKSEDAAFLERRRANLERFLGRISRHPAIRKDDILKTFLENPSELPKAKQTAAVSSAGFMRLVKNVGDSISKVATKKSETDVWFEDRLTEYEVLEHHLKKLHNAIENMIGARKDLCASTGAFVKSISTLANVEENNSISKALDRLSAVEEKVESLHQEQSNKDLYVFGETIRDYVMLMGSIKETFNQRVKVHNNWLTAQKNLQSKREQEAKLTATGKVDKLPLVQDEIHDWEKKEKEGQKAFEKCSRVLKREVERFEEERTIEFKEKFIEHLEALMKMQEELVHVWEEYIPDAQAIEVEA